MRKRYLQISEWFTGNMPDAASELNFNSPYQLIVAVILSAQCTDKRVNMVTPGLFSRYPDVEALAGAAVEDILSLMSSISYPNSKAAHLSGMAKMVVSEFGGRIPEDMESLLKLPGVGRKTANVVSSILFDNPVIAVDTHVFRVARRLGLSRGKTPLAVEKDLEAGFPPEMRPKAHHWLILHGRYVCTARSPKCNECDIAPYCKKYSEDAKRG